MAKSSNLYARIEPDVKEKAKSILSELGIPASTVLPHPVNISRMTEAQFYAELEKGYTDMLNGNTVPAEQAFAELHKEFNV